MSLRLSRGRSRRWRRVRPQVLAIRLTDRIGKGIRTSPRDALLADSAPPHARGRAFGFHAAMDNAGAVLGPLLAFMILKLQGVGSFDGSTHLLPHDEQALRNVFWLAAVPGFIALAILIVVVRDVPPARSGREGRRGRQAAHRAAA